MSVTWKKVRDYTDIIFEKAEGMGKITINRPEVRNAFRPETLTELIDAFNACREDPEIGVVILTGAERFISCTCKNNDPNFRVLATGIEGIYQFCERFGPESIAHFWSIDSNLSLALGCFTHNV